MSEVGDSALAFFLPPPEAGVVDKWRLRYDPRVKNVAPHITVAFPPFIPAGEWPFVRADMIACVAGFATFDVTIQSTGVFNETPCVLWLRPEDGGHFAHIHQTLAERFSRFMRILPFEYIPHVTIGFFDDLESLHRAQQSVLQELKPFQFQVTELCMGSLDADLKWQLQERLPLGKLPA